jgi:hypothetical protein
MAISFDERVRVPDHVLVRQVGGEAVLLDLDREECFGLDDVGTTMWEALNSASSVEEAYQRLLEQFDIDGPTLRRDLSTLIDRLIDARLLQTEG